LVLYAMHHSDDLPNLDTMIVCLLDSANARLMEIGVFRAQVAGGHS